MGALRLHLGVRKTGTTYLQRWLDQSEFVPDIVWVNERVARSSLRPNNPLPEYLLGNQTVVLSDENLLDRFYSAHDFAKPSKRLRALGGMKPSLFLCLRNYADYFTSSWSETIKRRPYWSFDPGKTPVRRWCDVLRELVQLFPNSPITVWDYADLRDNEEDIARLITGNNVQSFGERPRPQINQRLSVSAVNHLASLHEPPAGEDFRAFFMAHRVSPTNPRFDPFTPATRAPFDDAYAEDWAEIGKYATIWRPSPSPLPLP